MEALLATKPGLNQPPVDLPWKRHCVHADASKYATYQSKTPDTFGLDATFGLSDTSTGQPIHLERVLKMPAPFCFVSGIRNNAANHPKTALNLYRLNSAKTPTTIRPVTL